MSTVALQQIPNVESLQGRLSTLGRGCKEHVGWHHGTVKPMNSAASAHSADNADVAPGDFCKNVGDEKFRQSERVWRTGRLALHSHRAPRAALGLEVVTSSLSGWGCNQIRMQAHQYFFAPPQIETASNFRIHGTSFSLRATPSERRRLSRMTPRPPGVLAVGATLRACNSSERTAFQRLDDVAIALSGAAMQERPLTNSARPSCS